MNRISHILVIVDPSVLGGQAAVDKAAHLARWASSHGRWHRMVVGSTAATILESLPCDILIVRPSDEAQAIPF
jgi:nucleotide-binding universal stress UspA family protein